MCAIRVRESVLCFAAVRDLKRVVINKKKKKEIRKMSRRNRRRDSTMDSSSHIAVQVPDVIYLFLEIMFVMFEILL